MASTTGVRPPGDESDLEDAHLFTANTTSHLMSPGLQKASFLRVKDNDRQLIRTQACSIIAIISIFPFCPLPSNFPDLFTTPLPLLPQLLLSVLTAKQTCYYTHTAPSLYDSTIHIARVRNAENCATTTSRPEDESGMCRG